MAVSLGPGTCSAVQAAQRAVPRRHDGPRDSIAGIDGFDGGANDRSVMVKQWL